MLSNIIETCARDVDNYTLQLSYYEFQASKFIEIKVFEYELLSVFKLVVNEMFINQYKPAISNVKQFYERLKGEEIALKGSVFEPAFLTVLCSDTIVLKLAKDVLSPDETKEIQIINLTKRVEMLTTKIDSHSGDDLSAEIKQIEQIHRLEKLQEIEFKSFYITKLSTKIDLSIIERPVPTRLPAFSIIEHSYLIRELSCHGLKHITALDQLKYLPNLVTLGMGHCTGVTDITPLKDLSKLEILRMAHCTGVTDITPLKYLSNLVGLRMEHCTGVTDITSLKYLSKLEILDMNQCTGITDITALKDLSNFDSLF